MHQEKPVAIQSPPGTIQNSSPGRPQGVNSPPCQCSFCHFPCLSLKLVSQGGGGWVTCQRIVYRGPVSERAPPGLQTSVLHISATAMEMYLGGPPPEIRPERSGCGPSPCPLSARSHASGCAMFEDQDALPAEPEKPFIPDVETNEGFRKRLEALTSGDKVCVGAGRR